MTARPLVPAARVVRRFSLAIALHGVQGVPFVLKSQSTNDKY